MLSVRICFRVFSNHCSDRAHQMSPWSWTTWTCKKLISRLTGVQQRLCDIFFRFGFTLWRNAPLTLRIYHWLTFRHSRNDWSMTTWPSMEIRSQLLFDHLQFCSRHFFRRNLLTGRCVMTFRMRVNFLLKKSILTHCNCMVTLGCRGQEGEQIGCWITVWNLLVLSLSGQP